MDNQPSEDQSQQIYALQRKVESLGQQLEAAERLMGDPGSNPAGRATEDEKTFLRARVNELEVRLAEHELDESAAPQVQM